MYSGLDRGSLDETAPETGPAANGPIPAARTGLEKREEGRKEENWFLELPFILAGNKCKGPMIRDFTGKR